MSTTEILQACATAIEARYVLPDRAPAIAADLLGKLEEGRYDAHDDPAALARVVTDDLLAASGDLHLRLKFHADGAVSEDHDPVAEDAYWRKQSRRTAGGMRRVERLDDDVAVVEIGPVLPAPEHAGEAIGAAMTLVADASALVLDVRGCVGGSPDGVLLLLSHLFGAEPVRLADTDSREDGVRQWWTLPVVPGRRSGPDQPVVVVTGPQTFSGGEAVAWDLQETGRATVVGAVTRGGAHPRTGVVVHPQLELTLPVARSVSWRTGRNWEGVGVRPDVLVDGDDALEVALDVVRARLREVPPRG